MSKRKFTQTRSFVALIGLFSLLITYQISKYLPNNEEKSNKITCSLEDNMKNKSYQKYLPKKLNPIYCQDENETILIAERIAKELLRLYKKDLKNEFYIIIKTEKETMELKYSSKEQRDKDFQKIFEKLEKVTIEI